MGDSERKKCKKTDVSGRFAKELKLAITNVVLVIKIALLFSSLLYVRLFHWERSFDRNKKRLHAF